MVGILQRRFHITEMTMESKVKITYTIICLTARNLDLSNLMCLDLLTPSDMIQTLLVLKMAMQLLNMSLQLLVSLVLP